MTSYSTESMKRLVKEAEEQVKFIPGGALKIYFRSANTLLKQAKKYKEEGDLINAYKFYMRYATLAIEKLPAHSEYKKSEHKLGKRELTKNAELALAEIQNLKPILEKHFLQLEAEQLMQKQQQQELKKQQQEQDRSRSINDNASPISINDKASPISINDRAVSRSINDIYPDNNLYKFRLNNWDLINELKDVVSSSNSTDSFVYDKKAYDHNHQEYQVNYPGISYQNQSDGYIYPVSTFDDTRPSIPPKIKEPPILPAKPNVFLQDISPTRISPTHSPPRSSVISMPEPRIEHSSYEYLPKPPAKEILPEYFAFTEGGEGLRAMIIPVNIYNKFIQIAASNTAKNLETCGVLCGRLSHNHFTVTSLVIPKQTATSDTCSMTNEEDLLEYVEENELLTLGWIHTHPTQTCFMSSMDLHTHSVYQLVLPEAIAIVCSPNKSPNIGIFRLTNPPGLQTVLQCERRGFHPHDINEEIDKEISNCGHVVLEKINLDIVDLR